MAKMVLPILVLGVLVVVALGLGVLNSWQIWFAPHAQPEQAEQPQVQPEQAEQPHAQPDSNGCVPCAMTDANGNKLDTLCCPTGGV
ncbi:MAG: hypothetical protein V1676_03840 [Candidatus Diapherotrites archaeon]